MIKEIIDVNGNKVIIKEGKVKTILNKDIRQTGFMDIETAFKIIHKAVDKQYELCDND